MAQLFDIKKVTVGPKNLDAVVELAANAPLMTSEDLEGTTRVWQVMPQLRDHVCLGDESGNFGEVMGATELAHLLEHVTVELLARTNIAGDITCGQTAPVGEREYKLTFPCPDDVLVIGALSSAAWLMQWAFSGGGDPAPDADAIAAGLVDLVGGLPEVEPADDEEEVVEIRGYVPAEDSPNADQAPDEPDGEDGFGDVADEGAVAEPAPAELEPEPAPAVSEEAIDEILAAPMPAAAYQGDAAEDNAPQAEPEPQAWSEPEAEPAAEPQPEYAQEGPDDEEPAFEGEPAAGPAEGLLANEGGEAVAVEQVFDEPEPEFAPEEELEPESEPEPAPAPAPDDWGMPNVPRPHVVR